MVGMDGWREGTDVGEEGMNVGLRLEGCVVGFLVGEVGRTVGALVGDVGLNVVIGAGVGFADGETSGTEVGGVVVVEA